MLAGRGAKPENGDGKATDYVKLFGCLRRPTAAGSGARRPSSQEARLGLQPFADYASALLAIGRPSLGKDVIGDLVAFDAERVLDDLGGMIAVTAVDGLLEQVPVPSGAVFRRDRDGSARVARRSVVRMGHVCRLAGECGALLLSLTGRCNSI
jgi:hypothetical protein